MTNLNIELENEYISLKLDEGKLLELTKKIFDFYMSCPEIIDSCCLSGYEYNSVSFDILFCDNIKTHKINKEYREKDYPADIITFAVFADSPEQERFVLGFEINLGEVIISLDKMIENANHKKIDTETEILFFISHGILHLLGFDHQSEEDYNFVISRQKEALGSIDILYDKI